MLKAAFVTPKGLVIVTGETKSVSFPEFKRNMDTDAVVGRDFTPPIARSIMAAEVSLTLKDHPNNEAFLSFVEKAFNEKRIVTLMFLNVEYISETVAQSDAEFYSGFVSRPSRTVNPDKADDGTLTMQVKDAWRVKNGVEVWRLPTGVTDTIPVEAVYGT